MPMLSAIVAAPFYFSACQVHLGLFLVVFIIREQLTSSGVSGVFAQNWTTVLLLFME